MKKSLNQSPNSIHDFQKQNRENFQMENPVTGDASTTNNELLCTIGVNTIGSIDVSMGEGEGCSNIPSTL